MCSRLYETFIVKNIFLILLFLTSQYSVLCSENLCNPIKKYSSTNGSYTKTYGMQSMVLTVYQENFINGLHEKFISDMKTFFESYDIDEETDTKNKKASIEGNNIVLPVDISVSVDEYIQSKEFIEWFNRDIFPDESQNVILMPEECFKGLQNLIIILGKQISKECVQMLQHFKNSLSKLKEIYKDQNDVSNLIINYYLFILNKNSEIENKTDNMMNGDMYLRFSLSRVLEQANIAPNPKIAFKAAFAFNVKSDFLLRFYSNFLKKRLFKRDFLKYFEIEKLNKNYEKNEEKKESTDDLNCFESIFNLKKNICCFLVDLSIKDIQKGMNDYIDELVENFTESSTHNFFNRVEKSVEKIKFIIANSNPNINYQISKIMEKISDESLKFGEKIDSWEYYKKLHYIHDFSETIRYTSESLIHSLVNNLNLFIVLKLSIASISDVIINSCKQRITGKMLANDIDLFKKWMIAKVKLIYLKLIEIK